MLFAAVWNCKQHYVVVCCVLLLETVNNIYIAVCCLQLFETVNNIYIAVCCLLLFETYARLAEWVSVLFQWCAV